MIRNEQIIQYEPSPHDIANLGEIESFLKENNIPYTISEKVYGMFTIEDIKGNDIELRYVSSAHYPMDNSKRFGESHKGIPRDYFINISKKNIEENNIRTIWIYDFELNQKNDIVKCNGEILKDFPRMKSVIFNTIKTATGHITHRYYARDCEVCVVGNEELRPFLNENCFYGYRAANVNLGLRAKKDKNGIKKGDLLFVQTFGYCYYGNKHKTDGNYEIELIRQSTKLGCQVIGGASKCLKHFFENYPTITIGAKKADKKEIKVNELIFYVDISHQCGQAMTALGYEFVSWDGTGFKNVFLDNVDEIYEREDGRKIHLHGNAGDVQERKPLAHKRIMELIKEHKIVSVGNAGTSVYRLFRNEYLGKENKN